MDSFYYILADEKGFKSQTFDNLLASGYYRMQHFMFTCNDTALDDEEQVIPVFWLRTQVNQYKLNKTCNTILKKCAAFSISFKPAVVDDEIEALYAQYKQHVPFSISSSCSAYLFQEGLPYPFSSRMIQVRDNGKLVATGYFDSGLRAIAGIMNIYHPQYMKYSLGKLLMLKKLQYARSHNMLFYYTGYISPGSTRFDYKTFPDAYAVEVLLPDKQQWVPYQEVSKAYLNDYYHKYLV